MQASTTFPKPLGITTNFCKHGHGAYKHHNLVLRRRMPGIRNPMGSHRIHVSDMNGSMGASCGKAPNVVAFPGGRDPPTFSVMKANLSKIVGIPSATLAALKAWLSSCSTADAAVVDTQRINQEIKATAKNMKAFAVVLPLASVSGGNAFLLITKAVSSFIKLYLLLLFLRVLLSWFPTFKWDRNPWIILRQVTDPYLNLFRGLVPPLLGTIDFTPLLGFIILQWLVGALDIGEEDRYW